MPHRVIDVNDVVVRFAGDSGDGMQLTGSLFANTSAIYGNELSTFPDYPAEIRAPHDTVSGVSGFQVHIGNSDVNTPGDYCDLLVVMNPAALMANARWCKRNAMIIADADAFTEAAIKRAGFKTDDPFTASERLEQLTGIPMPEQVRRLKELPVHHTAACDKDKMAEAILEG